MEANIQDSATIDLTGNPLADPTESSSSSGSLNNSVDLDVSIGDEFNPNKIRRSMPLRTKSCDPAQCTDILDNMYEIYYDQEVSLTPLISFSILQCIMPTLTIHPTRSFIAFSVNHRPSTPWTLT